MKDKRLQKAWNDYNEIVNGVAKDLFNQKILPYLKKHNYYFISGNGTFYIGSLKTNYDVDIDKLPKKIYGILQMEVEGMYGNCLGSLMPDYNPHE